jgi:hypothetical protein
VTASIVFDFDHHVCTACRGRKAHAIGHVLVDPSQPGGDFMLACTTCGVTDGPFAGPRLRDERGNHLPPPT